ncbi:TPA: hypothetical protein ACHTSK_004649 [Escherichia coli]|uniref:hypothetical protein n=1 Tax=Escherichia coli TaxID=562 RepID=UPI0019B08A49|nr:hypothetical protein [Escherichia coli]MEB5674153.1 hypothetical protein [Escherichia coli]
MNKYQKLRAAAEEEIMCRQASDTSDNWQDLATPEAVIALVDELAATKRRVTELEGMNAASAKYAKKIANSRDKLRNKVNELEARTVTIPDYQDDAYWVYEWSGLTFLPWTYQKDVIKAVRVAGVAMEGE